MLSKAPLSGALKQEGIFSESMWNKTSAGSLQGAAHIVLATAGNWCMIQHHISVNSSSTCILLHPL